MRGVAALLAWLVCAVSFATCDALILIQPAAAGPSVDPASYVYPNWILWAPEFDPPTHSALLSLVTGFDWQSDLQIGRLGSVDARRAFLSSSADLDARGFFALRDGLLHGTRTFVVQSPGSALRETSVMLDVASREGIAEIYRPSDRWPDGELAIQDVGSWNDVQVTARKAGGRVLVLEYPTTPRTSWSRFWLFGRGWSEGIPSDRELKIPGLISSRHALAMLLRPAKVDWVKNDTGEWGGAGHWLTAAHRFGPGMQFGFGLAVALTAAAAFVQVLREKRSTLVAATLHALLLAPSALVAAGSLAHITGLDSYVEWFCFIMCALCLACLSATPLQKRLLPDAHPLFSTALIGAGLMSFCDPRWSMINPTFLALPPGPSPEALGCWFAYLTAAFATIRGANLPLEWILRTAALALTLVGFAGAAWWAPTPLPYAFFPLLAVAFGEGFWRWNGSLALPLLGSVGFPGLIHGIAWIPYDRINSKNDIGKLDGSLYVRFLVSPLFVSVLVIGSLAILFGDRFFVRQMRRLASDDSRRSAVLFSASALGLCGISQPAVLPAALLTAIGGGLILLIDGLSVL